MASFKDRRGREEEEEGRAVERKGRGVAELLKGSVCVWKEIEREREGGWLQRHRCLSLDTPLLPHQKGLY